MIDRLLPGNSRKRRPVSRCVVVLVALGFAGISGVAAQKQKGELAQKYERDFRGLAEKNPEWGLTGPNADKFVKFEPEGVRITLPTGPERVYSEVGLSSRMLLKGDFEITLRYEILTEPTADEAGGDQTRITLGVALAQPRANAATLSRRVWQDSGPQFLSWMNVWDEEAGKKVNRALVVPAKSKTGRLRMARTGEALSYRAAEGDGDDFRIVGNLPFSSDDVTVVRVIATTGGPKAAFDVRVTDLQIRADAIAKAPSAPPPPAPKLVAPTKKYAQEYYQPFKGGAALPAGWEFDGLDADDCVRVEPAGLRFNVPAGVSRNAAPRAVKTGFGVKGDFEITLNFEILAEPPQADAGAPVGTRVSLGVRKEAPRGDVTSVARTLSSKSGLVFVGYSMVRKEGFAKPIQESSNTKAGKAQAGRLRLVRSGADVYYGASDGIDGEFVYFRTYPFGAEDLHDVRLLVGTGTDKAMLDVRVTDFHIRADAIPNMPASSPAPGAPAPTQPMAAPAPEASGKGWLAVTLAGGIAIPLLAAVIIGGVLYYRRRKAPAATSISTAFVSFACPECGKTLKAKAELAGKKVKCGQCGKAVLVDADI